jgi:hypothetical protein
MAPYRAGFLLLAGLVSAAATAAPVPARTLVFSDLCRRGDGFSGSRLALTQAAGGDSGAYQWGDTQAAIAPLEQLKIGADGKTAFRYMPDADNPEVFVQVTGIAASASFDGMADGKALHLPRAQHARPAIPMCR